MNPDLNRTVKANILSSRAHPAIQIQVAPEFTYAGRLQFILFDCAAVDLFLFLTGKPQIERLLMIQFEGYLDDTPYTYEYPLTNTVNFGNYTYLTDTSIVHLPLLVEQHPDAEAARVITCLRDQGYTMQDTVVIQRYIRVLDAAKRHEMLIQYVENAQGAGSASEHYADNRQNLHERAIASFSIIEG